MRCRYTKTDSRNAKVLLKYEEVILKYGEMSRSIRKQTLYEEVADEFDITWETAARIILCGIKNNGKTPKK
jgi:hypothetical protein